VSLTPRKADGVPSIPGVFVCGKQLPITTVIVCPSSVQSCQGSDCAPHGIDDAHREAMRKQNNNYITLTYPNLSFLVIPHLHQLASLTIDQPFFVFISL